MLLIRGINGERYARQINNGIVACRDLLSHLFCKTETTYPYANYYEALFSQTRENFQCPVLGHDDLSAWSRALLRFLIDPMVADTYMTFFHEVDERYTHEWLESQPEGNHYIFLEPVISSAGCVVGQEDDVLFGGAKLNYVSKPEEIDVSESGIQNAYLTLLFADNDLYHNCMDTEECVLHIGEVLSSYAPLVNRIIGPGSSITENEFRYIVRKKRKYYGKGMYSNGLGESCTLMCNGRKCKLQILAHRILKNDSFIEYNIYVLRPCDSPAEQYGLIDMMKAGCDIQVVPSFYDLDIRGTSKRWGYIGDKKECIKFVEKELGGVRRRKESEDYHFNRGRWNNQVKLAISNIDKDDENSIIVSPPGDDVYHLSDVENPLNEKRLIIETPGNERGDC